MTTLDTALIQQPGVANASLNGIPLRLNPQNASVSFGVKFSQTQTVGGMVVQIYGVTLSDLVVEGVFGAGGWVEQQQFFSQMAALAQSTADAQLVQPDFSQTGADVVLPSGSVRFLFPLLGYDFMVYLKTYDSLEGQAVTRTNTNFNPSWRLTLLIDNDNTGLVTTTAANQYLDRIASGIGYGGGMRSIYNGTRAGSDIANFLSQYGGGSTNFTQYIAQAFGGKSSSGGSSSPSSAAPQTSASGNEATVWNFLASKGLSAVAAAGIMGNLKQESGFDPQSLQPFPDRSTHLPPLGTEGYGLAQWTSAGRQQGLQDLANQLNKPVDSLEVQLDYLWQELTGPYQSALAAAKAASTPQAAASVFNKIYEGGRDRGGIRESNAQAIFNTYGKKG